MDLPFIWFLLIGFMFTMYAVLDGFDLGVGAVHLLARRDADRRAFINAIGPVWDGNEVWLVTGIGALFGAFPAIYASAFSGLYMVCMLLLVCLIFRAAAIEFRNKEENWWWRTIWDFVFAISSIAPCLLFGVVLGNIVLGLPIGADGEFTTISTLRLFTAYPLLVGAFVLSLFTLHGAIYLNLKTEGKLQEQVNHWIKPIFWIFLVLYLATTAATLFVYPHMIANFEEHWWAWILVGLTVLAVANVPRSLHHGQELRALITSSCVIAGTVCLFGIGIFPNFLPSSLDPSWSLTVYNTASSDTTLWTMLLMAVIGMPFVALYTAGIYWVFRGKVTGDKHGY